MKDGSPFPKLTVISMAGSHYAAKAISGLDKFSIPYDVDLVPGMFPPIELKKRTPPSSLDRPYTSVPIMEVGREKKDVRGSGAILKWVDDNCDASWKFYPDNLEDEVKAAEVLLDHLGLFIAYYHWVDPIHHNDTVVCFLRGSMPCCWPCVPFTPPMSFGRERFKAILLKELPGAFTNGSADADKSKALFFADLQKCESYFHSADQKYMFVTEHATAADLMLNAFLASLADSIFLYLRPCMATCLEDAGCPRLRAFRERMRKEFPINLLHGGRARPVSLCPSMLMMQKCLCC